MFYALFFFFRFLSVFISLRDLLASSRGDAPDVPGHDDCDGGGGGGYTARVSPIYNIIPIYYICLREGAADFRTCAANGVGKKKKNTRPDWKTRANGVRCI